MHAITGANFINIVGKYPLPNYEGSYQIVSREGKYHIHMNTSGNSQVYSHPLSQYLGADSTLNCGTIQYFADLCSTSERGQKLKFCYGPHYHT